MGWSALALSCTNAIAYLQNTGSEVSIIISVAVLFGVQVPYIVLHIWWIYKNTWEDTDEEPMVVYQRATWKSLCAMPQYPWQATSLGRAFCLIFGWDGWIATVITIPIRATIQGKWMENAAAQAGNKKGFSARYGPMFTLYSANGYGRYYGAFLLVKHLFVIWIIASTVDEELASNPDTAHIGAPAAVLVSLITMNGLQMLFLLFSMPFNDIVENVVQAVVALQQSLFFVMLLMEDDAIADQNFTSNSTKVVTA